MKRLRVRGAPQTELSRILAGVKSETLGGDCGLQDAILEAEQINRDYDRRLG